MKHRTLLLVGFWMIIAAGPLYAESNGQRPTVTFDRDIHFIAAEGNDVQLAAGTYGVEPRGQERLQLVPNDNQPPVEIQATSIMHDESLAAPVSMAAIQEGENDQVHLVFLLPNGQGLDAVGSFSGTRSRAIGKALGRVQVQTVVAQGKAVTPLTSPYIMLPMASAPDITIPMISAPGKTPPPAALGNVKGKWITWNYLYVNHPEIVAQALADVQSGKRARASVAALGSTTELNDMLKTNWSAEVAKMSATQKGVTTRGGLSVIPFESTTSANVASAAAFALGSISLPVSDLGKVWSGQRSTTTIMVTVPFDGYIEAVFNLESARRRFRIVSLVSYTGEIVNGQPVVAQQAQGGRYDDVRPKGGTDPTLVSMAGFASINVKARQQISVTVAFEPDPGAGPPVGSYQETLGLNAFGYSSGRWARTVPIRAYSNGINFGVLFYPEQGHASTLTNKTVDYPIVITNAAATPASASLNAQALPPGVTMDSLSVSFSGQGTQRQILRFHVSDAASDGLAQPIKVGLNSGGQTRSVDLSMTIYHPWLFWCYGFEGCEQSQNIYWVLSGDPLVGVHQLQLWIKDDGQWWWQIDAFNRNDIDIGGTDFRTNISFVGNKVTDSLDVHIGPRTEHQSYGRTNVHPWIHTNFLQAAETGVTLSVEEK